MRVNQRTAQQEQIKWHRGVRDITAVLIQPSLLKEDDAYFAGRVIDSRWLENLTLRFERVLQRLTQNPYDLLKWLEEKSTHRLGNYFEALFEFCLRHTEGISHLISHLPVRHEGRTLGEFDLIFLDHVTGKRMHLELAVKFYLRRRSSSLDWSSFVGPNAQDRLDLKLSRLFEHQLHLPQTEAGRRALPPDFASSEIHSYALVKGALFYPILDSAEAVPEFPQGISPTCLQGWWIFLHQLDFLKNKFPSSIRWRILPRLEWLALDMLSANDPRLQEWSAFSTILFGYFKSHSTALLVVGLDQGVNGHYYEMTRGFIVPDNWPQSHVKSCAAASALS